ncbi:MAG: prepilin-type N-terminal cleavage/methylation domain-containing protein, partial [Limisphaerales bacterium]
MKPNHLETRTAMEASLRTRPSFRNIPGFTLIELLVVIAII